MSVWHLPAEMFEPHAAGEVISHDDLLDFRELLEDDGWFSRLSGMVHG